MPPRKRHNYSVEFQLEVVRYAERHGNRSAASQYNLGETSVRRWRADRQDLETAGNRNAVRVRHKQSQGRPILNEEREIELVAWINQQREERLVVTRQSIMEKAKMYADDQFKASTGWLS